MSAAEVRFAADIAREIGVHRNTAQRWLAAVEAGESIDVKMTARLAMRAAAKGDDPWPES